MTSVLLGIVLVAIGVGLATSLAWLAAIVRAADDNRQREQSSWREEY